MKINTHHHLLAKQTKEKVLKPQRIELIHTFKSIGY